MPIDLTNTLKSSCGWSFASNGMNNLFGSRLYVTGMLTVFIVVLIMVLYPCRKDTPMWILTKLGFYIFLVTFGMVFIHDCVTYNSYAEKTGGDEAESIIRGINDGGNVAYDGDKVSINPAKQDSTSSDEFSHDRPRTDDLCGMAVGGNSDDLFDAFNV